MPFVLRGQSLRESRVCSDFTHRETRKIETTGEERLDYSENKRQGLIFFLSFQSFIFLFVALISLPTVQRWVKNRFTDNAPK